MTAAHTWSPRSPGRLRSSTSTSAGWPGCGRTAPGPSSAVATTSNPASARSRATASRHIGWSSATTTVTACGSAARRPDGTVRGAVALARERPRRSGRARHHGRRASSGASAAPPSCPRPARESYDRRAPRGPLIRPWMLRPRPSLPVAAASASRPGATPTPSSRMVTTTSSPCVLDQHPGRGAVAGVPAHVVQAASHGGDQLVGHPARQQHRVGRARRPARRRPRRCAPAGPAGRPSPLDGASRRSVGGRR